MYGHPEQGYMPALQSAKKDWDKSNSTQRWQMLQNAGYDSHRVLTLRCFENLPIEVKVDLNYIASRCLPSPGASSTSHPVPGVFYSNRVKAYQKGHSPNAVRLEIAHHG